MMFFFARTVSGPVCRFNIHNLKYRIFLANVLVFAFLLTTNTFCFATKKKDNDKEKTYIMTEMELQSELMGYADRFSSILILAFENFEALKPTPEARHAIMEDTLYTLSAVLTIAAGPNPQTALLDMVVLTTLGRIIYQDNMRRKYGKPLEVMAKGYRQMEADIWGIAAKVLFVEQQEELRQLIMQWRESNPKRTTFNYLRFSSFIEQPRKSTLVKKGKAGGLIKSVQQVTEEVGEMRMIAERALFLGTRMPLLTGYFAELWMSQTIVSPEAQKVLADVHGFSSASERLANVAEQLPDKIMDNVAIERKTAIDQLIKAIDNAEREGEELVDHTFLKVILLIVIGMIAYISAKLVYNYLNKKLFESRV